MPPSQSIRDLNSEYLKRAVRCGVVTSFQLVGLSGDKLEARHYVSSWRVWHGRKPAIEPTSHPRTDRPSLPHSWYDAIASGYSAALPHQSTRASRHDHVDDPVGAVSVHGICGVWGTLAVGLFGTTAIDPGLLSNGLLYGGTAQIGIQALGVAAVFAFVLPVSLLLFKVIQVTMGLRVSEDAELEGLDISEHGNEAYADFQVFADLAEDELS
ncbi:MAG: hypothetical protein GVY36_08605 [Verrucomicrobia bacterium]|nr:hypothetical protein [Verrucomicrobiota bacterium]